MNIELLEKEKSKLEKKLQQKPLDYFFAFGWTRRIEQIEKEIEKLKSNDQ